MRHLPSILIAAVLLLSACGTSPSTQPAAQATTLPTALPPTAAEPTAAPPTAAEPTEASARPTSAPTAAQPTSPPQSTAEPTARLILPAATGAPGEAAQPSAVPSADAPPPNATAAPRASTAQPAAAQPTAAPEPAAPAAAPSQPVRIEIAEIGLDGRLASVGLDENRVPIVPKHDIAWYNLSAQPGAGENIVLWGHVLRFRETPNLPAPFARLKELKPGAAVVLYDKNGGEHRYTVTQQIWVKPEQVEYILPRGKEMVTMVSCIGDKVITGGEVVDMSNRLITIAEPEG